MVFHEISQVLLNLVFTHQFRFLLVVLEGTRFFLFTLFLQLDEVSEALDQSFLGLYGDFSSYLLAIDV